MTARYINLHFTYLLTHTIAAGLKFEQGAEPPWPVTLTTAAAAASAASPQSHARSTKLSDLLIAPCDALASYQYRRVHRSRGTGLWLVLINIYAVIGRSSNIRWS